MRCWTCGAQFLAGKALALGGQLLSLGLCSLWVTPPWVQANWRRPYFSLSYGC